MNSHRCISSLLFASVALALAFDVSAAGSDAFRVCADPNNPPFSSEKHDGFENKIAELFAKELHQKVEYTWFPQRIGFIRNTLKAKKADNENEYKCDVVMGFPVGFDQVVTTKPFYHSTYALVYAKSAPGMDDVATLADFAALDGDDKAKLKVALFDQSAGTPWLLEHGFGDHAVPYPSLGGDASQNTAQIMKADFAAGKIQAAILWGPTAAWVVANGPKGKLAMIPLRSEANARFDFAMAMGVRHGDDERKKMLDKLIEDKAADIQAILSQYGIPQVDDKGLILPQ